MASLVLAGFSALNEDSSSSSVVELPQKSTESAESAEFDLQELQELDPRAEEEATLSSYNDALRNYGAEEFEAAERLFDDVLESKFLAYCRHYGATATGLDKDKTEVEAKLRYNALKYLGLIRGEHRKDYKVALDYFYRASQIDKTDVQMLFKYGIYALKDESSGGPNYHLARAAFEHVLNQSPDHRPSLDCLMSITYKLGDMYSCLDYIAHMLELAPGHEKALRLKRKCDSGEISLQPDVLMGRPGADEPIHDDDRVVAVPVTPMTLGGLLESVARTYRQTDREDFLNPCQLEEEKTESAASLEVSVQNCVNEIVDLVAQRSEMVRSMARSILDEIIDQNISGSNVDFVHSLLDDVLTEVVTVGEAPEPDPATENKSAAPAANPKAKSFLDAVPIDLIEKRRSTRARGGGGDILNEDTDSATATDQVTVKSMLESFIPRHLLASDESDNSQSQSQTEESCSKSATTTEKEKGDKKKVAPKRLKELPSDEAQGEMLRAFLDGLESEGKFQNMLDVMRKSLHFVCRSAAGLEWTQELRAAFTDLYLLWRSHFELPNRPTEPHDEELDIMVRGCTAIVDAGFAESRGRFLREDMFHLRYQLTIARPQRLHDILGLHFSFYLHKEDTDRAIAQGKMVLDEYPDPADSVVTALSREYVEETVKSLEYSKNLPRVQAFFENEDFDSVVQILSRTIDLQNPKEDIWLSQMYMLVDSLWQLERYADCFQRSVTLIKQMSEKSITDVTDDDAQEMNDVLASIDCCIESMDPAEFAEMDSPVFSNLCSALVVLMTRQIYKTSRANITPWTLMYKVLRAQEEDERSDPPAVAAANYVNFLPNSVNYLASAHDYLGNLSSCTSMNGKFLMLLIDVFVPLMRQDYKYTARIQDQLKKALDQAIFCLYCHPSKKSKSKYLVDHGISNLALRWDRCEQFYSYVYPKKLPEFDDYKQNSISNDTEALFKRFYALVPEEYALEERKAYVKKRIAKGKTTFRKYDADKAVPLILRDLFYLLADYSFKNSEFKNAVEFYILDLSFNPDRLDSWIAMSLSKANTVEEKISENVARDRDAIFADVSDIEKCFARSVELSRLQSQTIYIESANFLYMLHSFCSNCLKNASEDLTMEKFNELEQRKSRYLDMADKYYTRGLEVPHDKLSVDERWLMRCMRGKIREKRGGDDISEWLEEYMKATELLFDAGGPIVKKIIYNTPTEFALELLEVQYRIYTSMIKMELRGDGKDPSPAKVKFASNFIKRLRTMQILGGAKRRKVPASGNTAAAAASAVPEVVDVEAEAAKDEVDLTWEQILQECISALESVVYLFPHHFKSLYQLARFFAKSSRKRDIQKAKEYLLLPGTATKAVSGFMPLFGERKANNFFNGIWRMPLTEFDRAGSFSRHVGHCVALLFDVAKETGEYQVLCDAACLLKKPADSDKMYLFEEDRVQLAHDAHTKMVETFAAKTERLAAAKPREDTTEEIKFVLDLFNTINRLKRFSKAGDDAKLKQLLMKMYEWLMQRAPRSFEEANSFCQRILQLERTAIRGGSCNKATSLSDILKHLRLERDAAVKATARKEEAARQANANAAAMLQAAQQQQYYKDLLSLTAAMSAPSAGGSSSNAAAAAEQAMLAAAVAASPDLASQYSQYVAAVAAATSPPARKRDHSADSASSSSQMPKAKKPRTTPQASPAATAAASSASKSSSVATPSPGISKAKPKTTTPSPAAASAKSKAPAMTHPNAAIAQRSKSSLAAQGKLAPNQSKPAGMKTSATPHGINNRFPNPAAFAKGASGSKDGPARPTKSPAFVPSAAASRNPKTAQQSAGSSAAQNFGCKRTAASSPQSQVIDLTKPGAKPKPKPSSSGSPGVVNQAKTMFGAAPKPAVNPLLHQQPKQGSRPGPSTGARPMPASQKVKQVQGQQRSRPSPPPAKKVSGPGGIVGEEDFEEDDVICID